MEIKCPNCGTEDIMTKQTIIDADSSVSITEGSSIGITGSLLAMPTISYGKNRGRSITQSGLVAKASPPKKSVGLIGMFLCSGIFMLILYGGMAAQEWGDWLIRLALIVIGIPLFILTALATLRNEDIDAEAMWRWHREWMCRRCSHVWIP